MDRIARRNLRHDQGNLVGVPGVVTAAKAQPEGLPDFHAGFESHVHRPCQACQGHRLQWFADSGKLQDEALDGRRPNQSAVDGPQEEEHRRTHGRQEQRVDLHAALADDPQAEDVRRPGRP